MTHGAGYMRRWLTRASAPAMADTTFVELVGGVVALPALTALPAVQIELERTQIGRDAIRRAGLPDIHDEDE